ncbi:transmembrane protein 34 [Reticulomyxa filosa]|uniref:Transmembrane protein 34 n=1 Tax=Reticulomyxa filosa TaxID=46433 RepID=X6LAM3_RETFI|nr:transmembrane protein 34 [Reticulomyxa filosa]|eukprot:ETN98593.1 transmembrane protein 34 [Reticulomyxa filosa]
MQKYNIYEEGVFEYNVGYPYITCLRSMSQTWAIYCLALFYVALKKQSHDSEGYQIFMKLKPVNKFLCVKGIVFFTYWQSVLIAGLVWLGLLKRTEKWDENSIAVGLQDFIICIEMFFASVAHLFAFQIHNFQQYHYSQLAPPHHIMFDVANMQDVVGDARDTLRTSTHELLFLGKKRKEKDDTIFFKFF